MSIRPMLVGLAALAVGGGVLMWRGRPLRAEAPRPRPVELARPAFCAPARSRFAVASLYADPPPDDATYGEHRLLYPLKLLASLRAFAPAHDAVLFVPLNGTRDDARLRRAGWRVCALPPLAAGWAYATRQTRVGVQSKLYAWALAQYEAVLFLDFDTLVVGDLAPLFGAWLAAMARSNVTLAVGRDYPQRSTFAWHRSDCAINAGVLLVRPSVTVFTELRDALARWPGRPGDSGEQAFLEQRLYLPGRALTLPPQFNAVTMIALAAPDEWRALLPDMRVLHYTMAKPHDARYCAELRLDAVCALWARQPPLLAVSA